MKVGIVDVVKLLDQSAEGLAGAKKMEELYNGQQRELAPLIAQAQKAKRGPDAQKLEEKAREQEQAREKLRAELRQQLLARAQTVIAKAADRTGCDFILAQPQALLWAKPELDLTAEVLASLDGK